MGLFRGTMSFLRQVLSDKEIVGNGGIYAALARIGGETDEKILK